MSIPSEEFTSLLMKRLVWYDMAGGITGDKRLNPAVDYVVNCFKPGTTSGLKFVRCYAYDVLRREGSVEVKSIGGLVGSLCFPALFAEHSWSRNFSASSYRISLRARGWEGAATSWRRHWRVRGKKEVRGSITL